MWREMGGSPVAGGGRGNRVGQGAKGLVVGTTFRVDSGSTDSVADRVSHTDCCMSSSQTACNIQPLWSSIAIRKNYSRHCRLHHVCLHAGVTGKFDIAEPTANDSSRGLAYSSRMDPRHGPLFTPPSRFIVLRVYCSSPSRWLPGLGLRQISVASM
jgi:hypothetical protein